MFQDACWPWGCWGRQRLASVRRVDTVCWCVGAEKHLLFSGEGVTMIPLVPVVQVHRCAVGWCLRLGVLLKPFINFLFLPLNNKHSASKGPAERFGMLREGLRAYWLFILIHWRNMRECGKTSAWPGEERSFHLRSFLSLLFLCLKPSSSSRNWYPGSDHFRLLIWQP